MFRAGRVGDMAFSASDAHGCPVCAHPVMGPAIVGSDNVLINNRKALRVTDSGIHSACCGSNSWVAKDGARAVFINGLRVHRQGDATRHCGGAGQLIEGSPNVLIGDKSSVLAWPELSWIEISLHFEDGSPACGERFIIEFPDGTIVDGLLDSQGHARVEQIQAGTSRVHFPELAETPWDYA